MEKSRPKKYIAVLLFLVLVLSLCSCGKGGQEGGEPEPTSDPYEKFYGVYKIFNMDGEVFSSYASNVIEASLAQLRMTGSLGVFTIAKDSHMDFGDKRTPLEFTESGGLYYASGNDDIYEHFGKDAVIYADGDTLTIECQGGSAVYTYENVSRYSIDPSRYYGTFVFKSFREADDLDVSWKDLSSNAVYYERFKDSKIVLGDSCELINMSYHGKPVTSCEMDYEAMVLTVVTEENTAAYVPVVFTEQGMRILENPVYYLLVKEQ